MTAARIAYAMAEGDFRTPRGNHARMHFRAATNDWNTLYSAMDADEYLLGGLPPLSGTAVDVGAHIGAVGIGLAVDNPGLHVVCVEPVPENAELIRANARQNDVRDRVHVWASAAAAPDVRSTNVRWRFRGSELADHHAFIGNTALVEGSGAADVGFDEMVVPCIDLSSLLGHYKSICLLKIDCEGCEWGFLSDPAISQVPLIVGEWHPTGGRKHPDLVALLGKTHRVSFSGPEEGPGGFRAGLA